MINSSGSPQSCRPMVYAKGIRSLSTYCTAHPFFRIVGPQHVEVILRRAPPGGRTPAHGAALSVVVAASFPLGSDNYVGVPESVGAHAVPSTVASPTGSPSYPPLRPALPGDRDADVCIVGAGYTGLWTAYYLKRADPSLRIAVLEARFAGLRRVGPQRRLAVGAGARRPQQDGAAVRPRPRGGLAAGAQRLRRRGDRRRGARRHRRGHRQGRHHADRPQRRAGVAAGRRDRRGAELEGRRHRVADESRSGRTDSVRRRGVGLPHPHCARIQPAQLARGLADTVERLGVDIYEQLTRHRDRGGSRDHTAWAPSPRRSCCARPRASPRGCRGCGGAGCR